MRRKQDKERRCSKRLFQDILKKTDRGHPDFADLELAISKLQEFTVHMDAEAQRAESLRIIESKLAGDLKLLHAGGAGRRFLHEGPLVDASRQRKVVRLEMVGLLLLLWSQEKNPNRCICFCFRILWLLRKSQRQKDQALLVFRCVEEELQLQLPRR